MKIDIFSALFPNHSQFHPLFKVFFPLITRQDFVKHRKEVARVEIVAGARPPRNVSEDARSTWLLAVAADKYLVYLSILNTLMRSQNFWRPEGRRCVTPGFLLLKNFKKVSSSNL